MNMFVLLNFLLLTCPFVHRFVQDAESDSNAELESNSTGDTETSSREQNNNSMFQQNLESHTESALVNAR